jgi:hypothetical protein
MEYIMYRKIFLITFTIVMILSLAACAAEAPQDSTRSGGQGNAAGLSDAAGQGYAGGQNNSAGQGQNAAPALQDPATESIPSDSLEQHPLLSGVPAGDLTQAEMDGLLWMREEEKLARDVYLAFYDLYNMPVFQNIAGSEQAHMDSVKTLLDTYGLSDPAANTPAGVFVDPELQTLYDQLISQGSQSLADALKVGAAIEEIDILDLQENLALTDNADIQMVYENLLSGSENHLRAFVGQLASRVGETYQPQYLSLETYTTILAAQSGGLGRDKAHRAAEMAAAVAGRVADKSS